MENVIYHFLHTRRNACSSKVELEILLVDLFWDYFVALKKNQTNLCHSFTVRGRRVFSDAQYFSVFIV